MIPPYFLSVEHLKFQGRYGKEKGNRICAILGLISGWGFFLSWIGIWVAPQPRIILPILGSPSIVLPAINLRIPLLHLIVSIFFLMPGAWFGVNGVRGTTLRVAETHRTEKVVTGGIYSIVRHPQYLGGLLAHVGISFLLSALYSLLFTPLIMILIVLISMKEERELIREFRLEYEEYRKRVPMLIPGLRRHWQD
ncbi:MAG: isoprenylcysteine carboxylmethyltransferase family protein [Candidatus Bathyarchaeota archaeon]|nr:MAG: isoprenylcysteine carboxylmethyltransferase family protein [Candidatus Bathyarchaeota archaeon]